MKLYFLVIIIFFQFSNLLAVDVETAKDRRMVLKAKTCEPLEVEAKNIIKWTSRVESRDGSIPKCTCSESVCEMDVTELVPLFAKKWHGIPSKHLSGNCWNTMFNVSEILPHGRSTDPSELTFILNSPMICKEKKSSEEIVPGDIVLIRENNEKLPMEQRELHGFVYISDELSFQKKGPGAGEPIELVESRYAYTNITNPLCKNVDGHPPTSPEVIKKCPYYANVFSCKSIKEVKKENSERIKKEVKDKLEVIDQYECQLDALNNSNVSSVSDTALSSLKNSLSVIKHWAEKHKEQELNEADLFFTNYILERANASQIHIDGAISTIGGLESQFPGLSDEEFDSKVAERELHIASWYQSKKGEIDALYELLDFTKKFKRLPKNDQGASVEEKELYSKLNGYNISLKLKHGPERFEIYLDEEVYKGLIANNGL